MDTDTFALILLFLVGYTAIAAEHSLGINKSWTAILIGSLMWIIVSWGMSPDDLKHYLMHESWEIFNLIVFLLGAMTVVEMMGHFRFFTWLERELTKVDISNRKLFWILGLITFFGSSMLDNLTITLIMIQVGKRLYLREENFNYFVINTIIAANAGGAFSPVGDVTTIMIWLAGMFTAWEVILGAFVPSLVAWIVPQAIITSWIVYEDRAGEDVDNEFQVQWPLIALGLSTFGMAVMVNAVSLPPFIGILLGLGFAGVIIDMKTRQGDLHYKAGQIVNLVQKADLSTLIFFIGILLSVGALNARGILNDVMDVTYGQEPTETTMVTGHTAVGLTSAVLDNVPLTAGVIKMFKGSSGADHEHQLAAENQQLRQRIANLEAGGEGGDGEHSDQPGDSQPGHFQPGHSPPGKQASIDQASSVHEKKQINPAYWVLLAITAGTGGSILLIGSAPGVAAMGQVPSLTFAHYLRIGTLPALAGYSAAVLTWVLFNSGAPVFLTP